MNIIEISAMQDPIKMKIEIVKLAHKRKCTKDDIWDLINNYRKTYKGKRSNAPEGIGDTLQKILSRVTITNKSANDVLASELSARKLIYSWGDNIKIGKYGVDFLLDNLIIEIDKRKHHLSPDEQDNDFKRQLYLIKKGYTVLRFTDNQIYRDVVDCVNKIERLL